MLGTVTFRAPETYRDYSTVTEKSGSEQSVEMIHKGS